jgi:DNA-binding NarL/FixJ family response regulator
VLVIGSGTLFDEGLRGLLARQDGVRVSGTIHTDTPALLHQISHTQPDTIVISQIESASLSHVCEWLQKSPAPGALRVIVVRADDNAIDVYEKRTVVAAQHDDFITIVRGDDYEPRS